MKAHQSIILSILIASSHAVTLPGIPEPGLIFYGRVNNAGSTAALAISNLAWSITEPGTGRIVQLTVGNGIEIVSHNSESWYIARVPFQTTVVAGLSIDPLPANTFALSSTAISYNRSAVTVNGSVAAIKTPTSATTSLPELGVSPTTHGKMERVDLELTVSNQAMYDAWIGAYFPAGDSRRLPNADPDKDGIQNVMERALGLNPNASSVTPISSGKVSLSGQDYFTFTYRQASDASEISLIPEIAENLQNWSRGSASIVEISNVADGNARVITVRSAKSILQSPKAFIRLSGALKP